MIVTRLLLAEASDVKERVTHLSTAARFLAAKMWLGGLAAGGR